MPRADLRFLTQLFLGFVLLAFGPGCSNLNSRSVSPAQHSKIDTAIALVRPALVRIRVVSAEFGDGREMKEQGVGSGAIISKDGYIITNHHVAGHARRIFCTLWNREEVEADLIGTDPLTDISVIKLRGEAGREFSFVEFGDSAKLRVGDSVLAMGSPMALSQSVTLGIVSNTEMVMPRFWGSRNQLRLDGENVGALVRWIAHDAAIYGGNSGGPLVDLQGRIVGINEISYGLSGAIPGNLAQSVALELIKNGAVQRSWLGLDVQPLFKRSDEKRGVLVGGVLEDSPASRAGLRAGDLLLELDSQPVNVRFDEQMPEFMKRSTSLELGKEIPVVFKRNGTEQRTTIVPVERGEIFPKQRELKQWGLTVRDISPLAAREMKRPNQEGVLVTSVRAGGPAGESKPAIESRDVLIEVNGQPIRRVEDLVEFTAKVMAGKKDRVPVIATFERKAARYLAVVRVGVQELKDPGLEVTKAWLPVETQVISRDIARELGDANLRGFYITRVYPNSTAARAGLKPGDFITAVDGERLTATASEHEDELRTLIRQYDIGKTIELAILRERVKTNIMVELVRSPRLQREMKKYRNDEFEFTVRNVSFFDAAQEQWETDQAGALVDEVRSGGWAELGGLNAGDLILQVDGGTISDVDTLRQAMEQVAAARKTVVVIKVLRGIRTLFLEMEPNWKS